MVGSFDDAGAQGGAILIPCVWVDSAQLEYDDLLDERLGGGCIPQSDEISVSSKSSVSLDATTC